MFLLYLSMKRPNALLTSLIPTDRSLNTNSTTKTILKMTSETMYWRLHNDSRDTGPLAWQIRKALIHRVTAFLATPRFQHKYDLTYTYDSLGVLRSQPNCCMLCFFALAKSQWKAPVLHVDDWSQSSQNPFCYAGHCSGW